MVSLSCRTKQNRHPEVLALSGEPRRMEASAWPSFETPRKSAAPQDDGSVNYENA
jgi:hypothetical protein